MAIENTTLKPRPEWLMGGDPASIARQEAQGQNQLVASSQLPTNGLDAEHCATFGITVNGRTNGDSLFSDVTLPSGMEKRATDHVMWSELVLNGKVIATMFYKAAFYDRDAFIRWSRDEA